MVFNSFFKKEVAKTNPNKCNLTFFMQNLKTFLHKLNGYLLKTQGFLPKIQPTVTLRPSGVPKCCPKISLSYALFAHLPTFL